MNAAKSTLKMTAVTEVTEGGANNQFESQERKDWEGDIFGASQVEGSK